MTEKKHDAVFKIVASLVSLTATTICYIITQIYNIETSFTKVLGTYVSIVLISLVLMRFPKRFYVLALLFDFFAAALGSIINLYSSIDIYDRLVHYFSGIVLCEAGIIIVGYLFNKAKINNHRALKVTFAFFFSSSCAGFWEIYEFSADNLLGTYLQGSNLNTMGDILSGVLGALTYTVIAFSVIHFKKRTIKTTTA